MYISIIHSGNTMLQYAGLTTTFCYSTFYCLNVFGFKKLQ